MLPLLAQAEFPDVRLLTRNPASFRSAAPLARGWKLVVGSLTDVAPWRAELRGVGTVMHLAAATGKASRREQLEVNLGGTRRLLAAAEEAGVQRFLSVSSVAVTYRERPHYHYAEAKLAAESLFDATRLDWLVVRPTLVLGPGSPLLASLRRMARFPIPWLFGTGKPLVQPIHVDDLAGFLVAALALPRWEGRRVAAAGPETVSIEALLALLRADATRPRPRFVHLPLRPFRGLLALLEPLLLPVLPFTAGQLAFFANSSVPAPEEADPRLPAPRLGLQAMLGEPPRS